MKQIGSFKRTSAPLLPFIGLGSFLPSATRKSLAKAWVRSATAEQALLERRLNDHSAGATYGKPFAEWLLLDHEINRLRADIAWIHKYLGLLDKGKA
jgi:hypothetical protein